MNSPQVVMWAGVRWVKRSEGHSMQWPIRCDGCDTRIEYGTVYDGSDGSTALWCGDCIGNAVAVNGNWTLREES